MVKFDLNPDTGESTIRQLRQTIEDMNSLLVQCDNTKDTLAALDKSMGLNMPAQNLVSNCRDALASLLPVLENSLTPIEEFVKNMVAAHDMIAGATAGNLDLS